MRWTGKLALPLACLLTRPALGEPTEMPSAAAKPSEAENARVSPNEVAELSAEQAARLSDVQKQGSAAYRAHRYAAAIRLFTEALHLTPTSDTEARATLLFNLGSCSFQSGDYATAEARFVQVARMDSVLAIEARLHAGFAALSQNLLQRAEAHLAHAKSDASAIELRAELQGAVDAQHARRREIALVTAWRAGETALRKGDGTSATEHFQTALSFADLLDDSEKAYLHRGLAVAAAHLGNSAEEQRQLTIAYQLQPDARDLVERADSKLAAGNADGADDDYAQALEATLEPTLRAEVIDRRESLRHLSKRGLGGWLSAGLGYDTNAAQSGAADAIGVAVLDDAASPFLSASASFGYTFRPEVDWAITPRYVGHFVGLTDDSVQSQSIQEHTASVRFGYAHRLECLTRLELGVVTQLVGLADISAFTFGAVVRGEWHRDFAVGKSPNVFRLAADTSLLPTIGLDGFDYMDGVRFDLRLRAQHRARRVITTGWTAFRYYGLGAIDYSITADQLLQCGTNDAGEQENATCQELSAFDGNYHVPLGYWAPSAGVTSEWYPQRRLRLTGEVALEYRKYTGESFASLYAGDTTTLGDVEAATTKLRQDVRPRVGMGAMVSVDRSERVSVGLDYRLLFSVSNMERLQVEETLTGEVPETNYDYDNRNFTQQLLEARVDFVF